MHGLYFHISCNVPRGDICRFLLYHHNKHNAFVHIRPCGECCDNLLQNDKCDIHADGLLRIDQSINPKYVPNIPITMLAIAAILLCRVVVDPTNILQKMMGEIHDNGYSANAICGWHSLNLL